MNNYLNLSEGVTSPSQSNKLKSIAGSNKSAEVGVENGTFTLVTTLYGVTDKTGMVVVFFAFQNAANLSMGKVVNATELDLTDGSHNGIVDVLTGINSATLKVGEKFLNCVMIFSNQKLVCGYGYNSPSPRYEYVPLSLNSP